MPSDPEFNALLDLSARVGADPALVQGAGGNTSIKRDGVMWIKASGTWLRDALAEDIMVPVRFAALNEAISADDPAAERASGFIASELATNDLRPSIETVVHALMPQTVVVHVHCVETIAVAVRKDAEAVVAERLRGVNYAFVPYARPGLPLARAIEAVIGPETDVLILGNHGLVVAAETVAEAATLLSRVSGLLAGAVRPEVPADEAALERLAHGSGYGLPADPRCHAVATDLTSCRFAAGGSLYPDHVIFLGAGSVIAEPGNDAAAVAEKERAAGRPEPVVILFPGKGVLVRDGISEGALALARCLSDVTARIPETARLRYLTAAEDHELLNWEAEKYRQALNKEKGRATQ
jgi:rhamnose utilization protein RhaD (predicted bifunctional aldolase and dehydrogenase)